MMVMADAVQVNFSRPIPVFPLPHTVLLPHAVQPLRVFEDRYMQMIDHCLDHSGQLAMASFSGDDWTTNYAGLPSLRSAVCVGQIVEHVSHDDGQHDLLLHGVCRAAIVDLIEPEADRLYRVATLTPLESIHEQPPQLPGLRQDLRKLLDAPGLGKLRSLKTVIGFFDGDDVSTHALLELVGFALLRDGELRYQLLAEASPWRRADIIKDELLGLSDLLRRADRQNYRSWPKGVSWN